MVSGGEDVTMTNVAVAGLGDMGSGLARNLMAAGFAVRGFDPDERRMAAFEAAGGARAGANDLGRDCDAAFVMVMNGAQAMEAVLGPDGSGGLAGAMNPGGIVVLTATVVPSEARALAARLQGTGLHLVDSPVSGGYPGAQNGTLTMMAAGTDEVLERARPAMEAVSATIHRVGDEPGMGQTVKACLQAIMGSVFSATFEAAALAAKAGVDGDVLHRVVSTSSAGCGAVDTALENIAARRFERTGSSIHTMHKDLTIATGLAAELGVPLFTAAMAMQLFTAGRTKYPQADNWVVTRITEEIVGAELRGAAAGNGEA